MAKAVLISLLFLIGWLFIGPLVIVVVSPFLWRKGSSRAKLPSLNAVAIFTLLLGVIFEVGINQLIPEDEILRLLKALADLQIVQTAASLAVSEGRSEMSRIFVMQLVTGLLFVPVILFLFYREGPFRSKLDTFLVEVRTREAARPLILWLLAIFFPVVMLFSFYFDDDLGGIRSLNKRPFLLPFVKFVCLISSAIAWRLGAFFLSDLRSKK